MRFFVFCIARTSLHFCTVERKQSPTVIHPSMKKLLFALLFLLSVGKIAAQGWERTYNGGGLDEINGLAQTPDGGYIMTGYYNAFRVYLIKTDANGKQQWNKFYPPSQFGTRAQARSVVTTRDSGYAVVGFRTIGSTNRDILLFKTNSFGKVLWSKSFGTTYDDEGFGIVEFPNGDLAICGYQTVNGSGDLDKALFVARTDGQGNLIWAKTYNPPQNKKQGNALTIAPNGDLVVVGELQTTLTSLNTDVYVMRLNAANGDTIWQRTFDIEGKNDKARAVVVTADNHIVISGESTSANGQLQGLFAKIDGTGVNINPIWNEAIPKTSFHGLSQTSDGGFFVTGRKEINSLDDLYIGRFSSTGALLWERNIGKGGLDEGHAIVATPDGGATAAGRSEQYLDPSGGSPTLAYLVKIDKNGQVLTSYIDCNVFRDFNNNCQRDTLEPNLSNWIVKVEGASGYQYAVTNSTGGFKLAVDTGEYKVSVFPPNKYWESCTPTVSVDVSAFYDTVPAPLPVRSVFDCPNNQVDISTPILRRCADNTYSVRYCNFGTAPSVNTFVEVKFDAALTVKNSSIAGIQIAGTNTYRYNVGALSAGDCGLFNITAALDCNSLIGEAHCVEAHIYPDSFCIIPSNWDGSIIRAHALCENDSVLLSLQNVGNGDLTTVLEYVIVVDIVMITSPNNPLTITGLNPGEERVVFKEQANGKTYRIIAKQSIGYPGDEGNPTAAVEACKTDPTPIFSTGFYTMFPEDDADDFISTDCQETAETDYTPTDTKRGHPKGYGGPKYVEPQTDLDFLIQFNNAGTDTVQQVIIRDTLPPELDLATIRPGTASHAYDFEVFGNGIVQFTLPTAYLVPGSSASEGFVRFRVAQRQNLPCNTTIRNRAAIYFDFNAPVLTEETFHTICDRDSFLIFVKTKDIAWPGADVRVIPNPFSESALFEVTGVNAKTYSLDLFDSQGRKLFTDSFNQPTFRLFRNRFPNGVIFYRLAADGKPVATGKLIVGD